MKIPLLEGQIFDPSNEDRNQGTVVVSQTLARQAWPGKPAVGKRLRLGDETSGAPWLSVIGVVGDVLDGGLDMEPGPVVYLPLSQDPWSSMAVVVRSQSSPQGLVKPVQQSIWQRDPELPLADTQTMDRLVARASMASRFNAFSISALAALACVLALVGIFGVIGYFVGERKREFGIRMVLGARRNDVLALVLRHACALTAAGLALGVILALYLTRALAHLLFRIETTDPGTFVLCALLLFATALMAAALPAQRAASEDPTSTLRSE
jgi:putative ABC transport system permease protein